MRLGSLHKLSTLRRLVTRTRRLVPRNSDWQPLQEVVVCQGMGQDASQDWYAAQLQVGGIHMKTKWLLYALVI